jgi:iron uptake system component EfeO
VAGCTAKESATTEQGTAPGAQVTVNASDTACELSAREGAAGPTTFIVTNNGAKATEFYVYGKDNRVLAEVENISPGLHRQLVVQFDEPGSYTVACKPGMVGDGIRGDFSVTGAAFTTQDTGVFKKASEDYKAYVLGQAGELVTATAAFVAAVKSGDIAAAKAQYPTSRTSWERIEPVAESFPDDLDPRIDLREADLQAGQKWTGFHRLEKDLWVSGLQPDTNAVADQLLADITELQEKVTAPGFGVSATQIAGGAQGLLDEIAVSKITGEEDIFSHTDLWDFHANIEGSQAALAAVRPILDERNSELGKRVDQRFAEVNRLLDTYRAGDGFVSYTAVTEPQRQELSRAIDALSKEVSQVQGVIADQ